MQAVQDSTRPAGGAPYWTEALWAGLSLALADALASGLLRTPWSIHLLGLVLGVGAGLGAGLVAQLLKRRGLGLGLVLSFAAGLNSLSLVSKQLEPSLQATTGALAALLSLLAGLACLGCVRGPSNRLLLIACVPLSSLGVALLGPSQVTVVGAASLPLLAALLTRSPKLQPSQPLGSLLANGALLAVLVLPVAIEDPSPVRPDLPPATAMASDGAPDLLLVLVDTMRADSLGSEGPLARLAEEGVRFEQCISSAPWTLPSVSSILTGLQPSQHGATSAARVLPGDVQTLAEMLRGAGYQTAAFTGGAFVSASYRLDQGFEHFDATAEFGFRPFQLHVPLAWRLVKNRFYPLLPAIDWVNEFRGMQGITEAAERWLAQRERTRPYFLFLHSYEIHDYYLQHGSKDAEIAPEDFELSASFRGRQSVHPSELVGAPQHDLDYFEAIYKNRLVRVEEQLERFLVRLEPSPGRGRVLALTSDHGEGFDAARGRVHHGGRLHDDQLRVPLVLYAPGLLAPGQVVEAPVSTVDLVPSLLELASVGTDAPLAGSSLLSLLGAQPDDSRQAWSEERANGRDLYSLRAEGWKLLREGEEDQYFDLRTDPFEERALSSAPEHLSAGLDDFLERFPPHAGESVELDKGTEAHLRQIGYLSGSDEDD